MKATTKKLLAATFVLVVAVALAASSTYAWFAMNAETDIRQFDVNVTAGDNLLIAVTTVGGERPDQAYFKSYIAADEITGNNGAGQFFGLEGTVVEATTLALATTTDVSAFTQPYGPALKDGEGAYYAFDIHFLGSSALGIKLTEGTVTSAAGSASNLFPAYAWREIIENEYGTHEAIEEGSEITAQAKDAVRIAFGTNVYEPNNEEGYGNYGGTGNLAIDYYNATRGLTDSEAIAKDAPAPYEIFTAASLEETVLVTLASDVSDNGQFYNKVTVKIWLEGWDADAFDSIKTQVISTTLKFIGA